MNIEKVSHPVFTFRIFNKSNSILADIRPKRDYLNRFELIYRVLYPELMIKKGANLLECNEQIKRIFPNVSKARSFLMKEVIEFM